MKLLITFILLLSVNFLFCQNNDKSELKIFSDDNLIVDLNYESWINKPSNVTLKPYSSGINISYLDNFIGEHSNICLAAGLEISSNNFFIDATPELNAGVVTFVNIPYSINYKKNKLTTTYLEIPFELRFRTNKSKREDKSFKIFLGFKVGYLISNHLKYKGDAFDGSGKKIKIKQYNIDNIEKYRYGVTARIGYGKFNITGFYPLTKLFEKDKGPDITPVSVGLSLFLF